MDLFLQKSPQERQLFIQEAAARTGKRAVAIEKDFWVCWTLRQIFSLPEFKDHLTFKGGTSLSKAYGLIERFSEDIDVSFHRDFLGFSGDKDPAQQVSGKERNRRLDGLSAACGEMVRSRFVPALEQQFRREMLLGGWRIEIDPGDAQTVLFHYPRNASEAGSGYLRPTVRIEMGARSDHWPVEKKLIRSYLNEAFPQLLLESGCCEVTVLGAERTFWEKATILHAECHRPAEKPMPDRHSRHYYDLARLAESDIGKKAKADTGLLKTVAEHKMVFFRSAAAKYEEAKPGTLRLVPPPFRVEELKRDYQAMEEMFFGETPQFSEILATLQRLEEEINRRT